MSSRRPAASASAIRWRSSGLGVGSAQVKSVVFAAAKSTPAWPVARRHGFAPSGHDESARIDTRIMSPFPVHLSARMEIWQGYQTMSM